MRLQAPGRFRILLLAEESVGIDFLKRIAADFTHSIIVMSSPNRNTLSGATVWSVAQQIGLPCWPAREVKDPGFPDKIRQQGIDLLLSIRSRYILTPEVIAACTIGAFNLHTGALPAYAGINVINWAIYNGESMHGITVHRMVGAVDAGDIAYTVEIPIGPEDSAARITMQCFRQALPLLTKLVETAAVDPATIPSIKQDTSKRNFYAPGIPHNGFIPWAEGVARAANFIRACDYFPFPSPWGYARTIQDDQELCVLKAVPTNVRSNEAHGLVGDVLDEGVMVSAGDFWVLVKELMLGQDRLSANEVLRPGAQLRTG